MSGGEIWGRVWCYEDGRDVREADNVTLASGGAVWYVEGCSGG